MCADSGHADTVDEHVALCAREREHAVVTSDPDDLARIDPGLPLIRVSASLAWATTSQDQGSAVSPSLRQSLSRNR